jgi:hypothetical protein
MSRDPHPHSFVPARPEPPRTGLPSEAPLSVHAAVVFLAAVVSVLVLRKLIG